MREILSSRPIEGGFLRRERGILTCERDRAVSVERDRDGRIAIMERDPVGGLLDHRLSLTDEQAQILVVELNRQLSRAPGAVAGDAQ